MWWQILITLSVCLFSYVLFKNMESKQNKVKYYSKLFAIFLYATIVSTILCPVVLFKKRDHRNALLFSRWFRHMASFYGMKWQLQNTEHLAGEGGAVIISNHQSAMDGIGMFYAWDKINKIVAVAKTELWYMGIVALAAYKSGAVFIDRKKPKDAYKSLRKIKEVLKTDGAKVWIYPEGTRNTGNTVKLLPFKKGAFTLAVDAQVPIIPIVFSPHYFINDKKHIFYNDGKAIMRCLEPVPTEGLTSEDIPELQERLHQIMWDAFVKLSKEILHDLPLDTPMATEILV